jgi:hypothetical protein
MMRSRSSEMPSVGRIWSTCCDLIAEEYFSPLRSGVACWRFDSAGSFRDRCSAVWVDRRVRLCVWQRCGATDWYIGRLSSPLPCVLEWTVETTAFIPCERLLIWRPIFSYYPSSFFLLGTVQGTALSFTFDCEFANPSGLYSSGGVNKKLGQIFFRTKNEFFHHRCQAKETSTSKTVSVMIKFWPRVYMLGLPKSYMGRPGLLIA